MSLKRPISDSPWFWVLVYSGWTFIAFALLTYGKYGKRQSQLERQYQGRMLAAEKEMAPSASNAKEPDAAVKSDSPTENIGASGTHFSTPDDVVIPLWPLTLIFLVLALFGGLMLVRERRRGEAFDDPADLPAARNAPT